MRRQLLTLWTIRPPTIDTPDHSAARPFSRQLLTLWTTRPPTTDTIDTLDHSAAKSEQSFFLQRIRFSFPYRHESRQPAPQDAPSEQAAIQEMYTSDFGGANDHTALHRSRCQHTSKSS